jgi:hypothetical protein
MRRLAASLCFAFAMVAGSEARADDASEAGAQDAPDDRRDELAQQARRRDKLRVYHRSMGITTWVSFASTMAIGTMRYANVVGFGEPLCAEGNTPILGRSYGCGDGLRIQHLVSASFTTASYISTRTLAALMPDPYDAAGGDSSAARRLRIHRALSWVHLAGMIAMPILGFATSATDDPHTRDTLATVHLVVGYSTFAAISGAASLMIF